MIATCPGCGAEVTFVRSAPITVCAYCSSVVARKDRDVESLGKVVDLVDTGSPLELGLEGRFGGAGFTLVGRMQLAHDAGGTWDEWYAAFDDGRWGWLAEAQGRLYLTFHDPSVGEQLPPWAALSPGQVLPGVPGNLTFIVAERAEAEQKGARGSIPFRFVPGQRFAFVDASGQDGAFMTLDYGGSPGESPAAFVGRAVTLEELGWSKLAPAASAPEVKAERIACPECDGNLTLRAPAETQRIACPYCGTLSSVEHGKLTKLQLLAGGRIKPRIELGAEGEIGDGRYTVIGFMRRFTVVSGVQYDWDEYLLFARGKGFRWLVDAKGHWTFATPIDAGEVQGGGGHATYRGQSHRWFQGGAAVVRYVLGEFYWKVAPSQCTHTDDYVSPPSMLSRERDASEINWSHGVYVPAREVERAFGDKATLGSPIGIAPNQPWPHRGMLRVWAIVMAVALVLGLGILATRRSREAVPLTRIDPTTSPAPPVDPTLPPGTVAPTVWLSEPFALHARANVAITLDAPGLSNSWSGVDGALINDATGQATLFAANLEYYSGVEGGEAWSEGDRSDTVWLGAPGPGTYILRLEISGERSDLGLPLVVHVTEGARHWLYFGILLLALSVIPVITWLREKNFEKLRWEDSGPSDRDPRDPAPDGDF